MKARTHARPLSAFAALAFAAAAFASDQVPAPPQREPFVVTGATLHTVSGPTIADGRLFVSGGRIVAVAAPGEALPPEAANARRLDYAGRHVYPGFIAANSALGLTEVQAVRATVDTTETGTLNPNARALVAINADSELLPVTRSNGVLAALVVPGTSDFGGIAGTSALVQLEGWNWDEMAVLREAALHVAAPQLRNNPALNPDLPAPLQAELVKAGAARARQIEDAFDAAAAWAKARAADAGTPDDPRWQAMAPVFSGQRPVFVHADDLAQIRWALALAGKHGFKLVIVGGADAWRIAGVLRERRVPVVIAGNYRLPLRRDDDYDGPYRLAAQLAAAGVEFCIARSGGDFAAANERNLPYEAATAAAFGLAREEALKAITLYPARILGVEDRLGSLQPGRLASFIVTDGDPLQVATRTLHAFVQGREIDLRNRQIELAEKYRQRYERLQAK